MRALSFRRDGAPSYGVHRGGRILEADAAFRDRYPDLVAVLTDDVLARLDEACGEDVGGADEIEYLPTITRPGKILCVGKNYRSHAEEMGGEIPDHPLLFVRFPGSIVGHGQPLVAPRASVRFDFEGELGVVIGRAGRHIAPDDALAHVAGYLPFMDGSVRDWQRHTSQFTAGKNFDESGSMGPWLVSADEIPDPAAITLETRLNGEVVQTGSAGDMLFDVPTLIAYCSTFATLEPGDVIATGTPPGVGAARTPPLWLKAGDTLEVDLGGVGCLVNPIRAESGN